MLKACFQAFPASNHIVGPQPRAMVLATRLEKSLRVLRFAGQLF
jgi:hypothetical protein